jgi:hypothetical protein
MGQWQANVLTLLFRHVRPGQHVWPPDGIPQNWSEHRAALFCRLEDPRLAPTTVVDPRRRETRQTRSLEEIRIARDGAEGPQAEVF